MGMRLFSVTEEMLSVDPVALLPAPLKAEMVLRYARETPKVANRDVPVGAEQPLLVGLLPQQFHVVGPPQESLIEAIHMIRVGRALADRAARAQGRRAVALGSALVPGPPVVRKNLMRRHGDQQFGTLSRDSFSCGSVVRIAVKSPEEGVQVLNRIRVWLPVLLALSTNSPFWGGRSSRFSSHRYFSCTRWPAPGPSEVFASVDQYNRYICRLNHPAAVGQAGVTNLDARLAETGTTVDVMLLDVCLDPEHAAVVAALTRALVEVAARQWGAGEPPLHATVAGLRASMWLAAVNGLEETLISPISGRRRAVGDVVVELLEMVHPVLVEYGETEYVDAVVSDMFHQGNGSRRQRDAYSLHNDLRDVVEMALHHTDGHDQVLGVPGPILAEPWNEMQEPTVSELLNAA